jgi:hypothetical protein
MAKVDNVPALKSLHHFDGLLSDGVGISVKGARVQVTLKDFLAANFLPGKLRTGIPVQSDDLTGGLA